MIYGVVAEELELEDDISGGGLLGSLDFVNGVYSINGVTQTAAQVVSNTGRISGSGLSVISGSPVSLLNDTLALLLTADWTIIIEFDAAADAVTSTRCFLLTLWDASFTNQVALYTQGPGGNFYCTIFEGNGGTDRTVDSFSSDNGIVGVNKLGFTCTNLFASVTSNGATADTDTTVFDAASAYTLTQVQCADANNVSTPEGYIRSIKIYSPVDDATLATMTA